MFSVEHRWVKPIYGVFLFSAIARLLVVLTFLPRPLFSRHTIRWLTSDQT
jgi:hypothetical protein